MSLRLWLALMVHKQLVKSQGYIEKYTKWLQDNLKLLSTEEFFIFGMKTGYITKKPRGSSNGNRGNR